ncbi:MAG: hypothetical protein ACHP9T_13295 [Caulobacterales bacterium]|jgi:hypothetical protein
MTQTNVEPAHPSPHRGKVGLSGLLYGLIAAPAAWVVSQIANSTLAQEACFPGTQPLAQPAFGGVHVVQAAIMVAALLIGVSAAAVSLTTWRLTRNERSGDQHALLSVGEGRSRFMALAGLLTSLGFALGILFSIPALLFVPAC